MQSSVGFWTSELACFWKAQYKWWVFSKDAMTNIILTYIIRKCTYVYVRFVTGFLSFFAPLGPFTLIVVHCISRKCAAMPQCHGLVRTLQYFPDLVGISPILLGIPSRPKCDRDRKKSRFWHLFWYLIWTLMILTQEQSIPTTDIQKKKNQIWAPGSCSTCTRRHVNIYRHENDNCFIEHFRQKFFSQTKNDVAEHQDFNTF